MISIEKWAQVLKTQRSAKKEGLSDVIYLDALENKYLEEVSSCNIFIVKVLFLLSTSSFTLHDFCTF